MKRFNILGVFLAAVWLIHFCSWFAIPLANIATFSFHERDYMGGVSANFSFAAWREILSPPVLRVVLNSLTLAALNTAICVVVGLPLSIYVCIFVRNYRVQRLLTALLIIPLSVNTLLTSFSWQVLLGNRGVINSLLASVGLSELHLLFRPSTVILGLFSSYLPFFVLSVSASLQRLDVRYLYASYSLGAGTARTIRHVILPMCLPGIVVGCLLVFLPSLAEYVIPDLLGGGKLFLLGSFLQFAFYDGRNWPLGAAIMTISVAGLIIFVLPLFRYLRGVFVDER